MGKRKYLYHGMAGHNFLTMNDNTVEPSWDGYVYLTTDKLAAARYACRLGTGAVVFRVLASKVNVEPDPNGLWEGTECFKHKGKLDMVPDSYFGELKKSPFLAANDANARRMAREEIDNG